MGAEVPRAAIEAMTQQVNALSADARKKAMGLLERIDWEGADIADCRAAVVEALEMLLPEYATASAQAAADYYDAARELALGKPLGAVAESGLNLAATEGAVRAFVRFVQKDGDPERFNRHVCDRIDWELKRAASNSALANGRRDPVKPRFARVPAGGETCRFCLMLASRGFVYHTEATAGMNHVHPSCDCRTVPGWDGMEVEGYDPDRLYSEYRKQLEGHELEEHYDLLERNGKTTKRIYKTAAYDYKAALGVSGKGGRSSKYHAYADGIEFKTFEDVRTYLYEAETEDDLIHRYNVLGLAFGFRSEQMQSAAMKNAMKHVMKRFK